MRAEPTADRGPLFSKLSSLYQYDELWSDEAWWKALAADGPAFLELAWSERVFADVYRAYRRWNAPLEEWDGRLEAFDRGREQVLAALPAVAERVVVLKGLGLEALYPPGRQRFSFDADLVVRDLDAFFPVARSLLGGAYELPVMLLSRSPKSGGVEGAARFYHADPLPFAFGQIELLIGMFPISSGTELPFAEFAARAVPLSAGGCTVRVPTAEDQLLVLVGELQTRARATIRDVYDLAVVLGSDPALDMAAVVERAVRYGMGHGLAVAADGVRRLYRGALQARFEPFLRHPSVRGARLTRSRAAHLWQHFRRAEQRRFPAARFAVQALRELTTTWNQGDRFLPLLKAMDANGFARRLFERGFATYFIRLDERPASGWSWLRRGPHAVVATPLGHFVASANALTSDAELDALEKALG